MLLSIYQHTNTPTHTHTHTPTHTHTHTHQRTHTHQHAHGHTHARTHARKGLMVEFHASEPSIETNKGSARISLLYVAPQYFAINVLGIHNPIRVNKNSFNFAITNPSLKETRMYRPFLVADTRLYILRCRSVGRSVTNIFEFQILVADTLLYTSPCWLVCRSIRPK